MLHKIRLASAALLGGLSIPEGAIIELDTDANRIHYNGRKLELGLTTADVHDPTELPSYLAGYKNEEFRHEEFSPIVLVDNDEDKYRTFDTDAAFTAVQVKTSDDAYPNEVKVSSSLTNYKVQPRRLAAFIPDTVQQQAGPNYDVRLVHMDRCARAIEMDLELDVLGPSGRGLLTTEANWGASQSTTLGAGFNWNGGVDSNPIADLRNATGLSAQRVMFWGLNQRVAGYLLDNPAFRDYTRAVIGDNALNAAIRAIANPDGGVGDMFIDFAVPGLGVFKVCMAKVKQTDGSLDYIMPNVVIGVSRPAGVPTNGEGIATSYTFRRRGPAGNGFHTKEVRIEQRGVGGTLVIAEEASIPVFTGTIVGAYIEGVVA